MSIDISLRYDFFKYSVLDDEGETEQGSKMLFEITLAAPTAAHPLRYVSRCWR
jgi:hypothetical protein